MKKVVLVLLLLSGIQFSNAQKALPYYEINNQKAQEEAEYDNILPIQYLNVNGKAVEKSYFDQRLATRRFFQIPGDSLHQRKLISRENHGKLINPEKFTRLLETELNIKIDPKKPIVVVYYPGTNRCNAGGSATRKTIKKWHKELEAGILGKTNNLLKVYKTTEGMKNRYDLKEWKKDPQGIMEQFFFPWNFPCNSFVVISPTGRYVSYFGEFGKPLVWKTVDFILKKG